MSIRSGNRRSGPDGRFFIGITIVLIFAAIMVTGCTSQTAVTNPNVGVKVNDTVKVHYTAALAANGRQFESSLNGTPVEFVAGSGMVIPGFDKAVIGMGIGENKTVMIPADQAYGPRIQSLVNVLPRDVVLATLSVKDPAAWNPKPGDSIRFVKPDGTIGYVYILTANETSITIDENHLLAGQDLIFTIQVVDIVKK
ncbi:MAG: FKBP-type peptidyl-prolyl cis-trans isomerase [Methanomicrobiales archaeon]